MSLHGGPSFVGRRIPADCRQSSSLRAFLYDFSREALSTRIIAGGTAFVFQRFYYFFCVGEAFLASITCFLREGAEGHKN